MSDTRSTNPSTPGKPSRARKRSKPEAQSQEQALYGADLPAGESVASPDPVSISLSTGDRESMVRTAAYFRAQQRNFATGHALDDWLAAEAEIDAALLESRLGALRAVKA